MSHGEQRVNGGRIGNLRDRAARHWLDPFVIRPSRAL